MQDQGGKYSTPVLWCKKEKTIVSNESIEILKMFNTAFNALARHPEVHLSSTCTVSRLLLAACCLLHPLSAPAKDQGALCVPLPIACSHPARTHILPL